MYSLYEALSCGDTLKGWWNEQRMWMVRRITSYLYGFIDTVIIATAALLNLICLVGGLSQIMTGGWIILLNVFFPQLILCGMLVVTSIPFYEAMFVRKDKGRIPFSITLASIGFAMLALLVPIV
jgi:hypothetical protein